MHPALFVFNSNYTQDLKAAVFSQAFIESGYEIDESETWDDYAGSGDEDDED